MRAKLCLFLSILCLLLTACTSSGQQAPVSDPAPAPAESTPEVETLLGVELTEDTPERERGVDRGPGLAAAEVAAVSSGPLVSLL